MRVRRLGSFVVVAAAALSLRSEAAAQSGGAFDHLQCFAIRDPVLRGAATADLVPEQAPSFLAQRGCKIKMPARFYCTDVRKQNLNPPPALPIGGEEAGDYLCYRVACPQGTSPDASRSGILVEDQFGARDIKIARRAQLLCVPAQPQPTPTSTPNVGADPPCSFDGQECQGACSTGRCVYDPNQNRCVCQGAFDVACDQFAQGVCAGHLCFAPGQVCAPGAQPTIGLGCQCVVPTPQPTP